MKHGLWFGLILVGILGEAHGQFNAFFYYIDCEQPLRQLCIGGEALLDGPMVELYWDSNNNGPDPSDPPAMTDSWPLPTPYRFMLNGEFILGCAGTFYPEQPYVRTTGTPQPSRYWMRICNPPSGVIWISDVTNVYDGLGEYTWRFDQWTCYDSTCSDAPIPPQVEGFAVSDTSCLAYHLSWLPYSGPNTVDSLFIYRLPNFDFITMVQHTETNVVVHTAAPHLTDGFAIRARNVVWPFNISFSNFVTDSGRAFAAPGIVNNVLASNTIPEHVLVSWTDVESATAYRVYRNGTELAVVEEATQFYHDATAVPDTIYLYQVSALNQANPVACQEGELSEGNEGMRPHSVDASEGPGELVRELALLQNYPNPFNAETTIELEVPNQAHATLDLFDVTGRHVRTLFDDIANGHVSVHVSMNGLASGIYIYRLSTLGQQQSNKMLLIR